ncbi:MAG: DUF2878 domain-containing protein [Wenzhouxiangellaceae bacterium]
MLNKVVNFILFNALWPVCVIGAAKGLVWPGIALVAVYMAWQLHPANRVKGDASLVALALVVGMILDSLWVRLGLFEYAMPWPSAAFAPVWIAALWIGFALALNHTLAWTQRWPWQVGLAFIVLSPFSYFMAQRLGAVEWLAPWWQVVLATGLSWMLFIPYLLQRAIAWRQAESELRWQQEQELV